MVHLDLLPIQLTPLLRERRFFAANSRLTKDASVPPPTASIQSLNWPFLNIRITSKPLIVA